ncbi:MAG: type II secretion system protein [Geothrix sp.]|nr:type II secretion system protein [Geothrix sp.]
MTPTTARPATRQRSRGFSLLELLVAMMIIAVLGTLGFSQYRKHSATARYLKAQDDLKIVSEGLDQYYLKHGHFPDFGSFDAMVDGNSSLVKESLIKVNMSAQDPFGQPYEGKSTRATYELKCVGDPNNQEDAGPIVRSPGQVSVSSPVSTQGTAGSPKADAPAGDAGVKK